MTLFLSASTATEIAIQGKDYIVAKDAVLQEGRVTHRLTRWNKEANGTHRKQVYLKLIKKKTNLPATAFPSSFSSSLPLFAANSSSRFFFRRLITMIVITAMAAKIAPAPVRLPISGQLVVASGIMNYSN